MNSFYDKLEQELSRLKSQSLFREFRVVENPSGEWVTVSGKRLFNLCSNNYLGIANHPLLKDAAIKAIERYGCGATSSRLIAGNYDLYEEAERELACFKDAQSALIFNSGFTANTGIIPALMGRGDLILSDKFNHASIIDGMLLSRAEHIRYRHCDMADLEGYLKRAPHSRKMIVTDSVFSMDGDHAPLNDLVELKQKYGAILMIDEAHGSGIFGENGRGLAEHYGVLKEIDINMGTLGKAFGCAGAYVAGRKVLIDYLRNKTRSLIFTTGLPPSTVASIIAAIKVVREENWRGEELRNKSKFMRDSLKKAGFNILNSKSQIIPIIIGDNQRALEFSRRLYEGNILAPAIRQPTVPEKTARVRLSIMATHEMGDLEWSLEMIGCAGREMGIVEGKL